MAEFLLSQSRRHAQNVTRIKLIKKNTSIYHNQISFHRANKIRVGVEF